MLNLVRSGAAALLVVSGLHAQSNPQGSPTPSGGSVQICLAAAADSTPVYPTTVLPVGGKELTAVFRLGPSDHFTTLAYEWIAVNVGAAAPPNSKIAIGDLPLGDQRAGALHVTGLRQPLPAGEYRLDVTMDGHPWKSTPFSVKAAAPAVTINRPADLLPLTPGKVWTYAFTQESGNGATITIPGISPGPDGKLHATVTLTVTPADAGAVKIETRRNNDLVFEEWWRLDETGLFSTQRHQVGDDPVPMKPPQKMLAYPPATPLTWTYEAADHSYKQTYRMWGPVPVKAPSGSVPGFVVMAEQAGGVSKLTAERHFAPGIGLVREIIITSLGPDMLSRQELVLQK